MAKSAKIKEVLGKILNQLGDTMVFCTLETGIFGLISEGQLRFRIKLISQKLKNCLKTFFACKF
jgi:hypothetical protein